MEIVLVKPNVFAARGDGVCLPRGIKNETARLSQNSDVTLRFKNAKSAGRVLRGCSLCSNKSQKKESQQYETRGRDVSFHRCSPSASTLPQVKEELCLALRECGAYGQRIDTQTTRHDNLRQLEDS